jgi:hypothetical protein
MDIDYRANPFERLEPDCTLAAGTALRGRRLSGLRQNFSVRRRGRLDVGCLLLRAAHVRVAPLAEVAVEREDVATTPMRHSMLATIDHRLPPESDDAADVPEPSPSSTATPGARAHNCHRVRGPATLGALVATDRADASPYREWVATLADRTNVVVTDWCAAPSLLGIEKAVLIVQSRAYLEHRARLLLQPFGKQTGSWRLATIDFGTAAQRHRCEFLMCFAVQDPSGARHQLVAGDRQRVAAVGEAAQGAAK